MLSNNDTNRKSSQKRRRQASRQRRRQRKWGLLFDAGQVRQMHSATARQELMICRAVLMCELEKSRRANRSTTAIKLEVDRCNAALGFSLMSFGPELKPSLQPRSCHNSSRWPAIDEPARSLHPFWPRLCIYAMRVVILLRRLGEAACPSATRTEGNPALEVGRREELWIPSQTWNWSVAGGFKVVFVYSGFMIPDPLSFFDYSSVFKVETTIRWSSLLCANCLAPADGSCQFCGTCEKRKLWAGVKGLHTLPREAGKPWILIKPITSQSNAYEWFA